MYILSQSRFSGTNVVLQFAYSLAWTAPICRFELGYGQSRLLPDVLA